MLGIADQNMGWTGLIIDTARLAGTRGVENQLSG